MIQSLESAFIRPPRQTYYIHDLGPQQFPIKSIYTHQVLSASRIETSISNPRYHSLSLSFFQLDISNTDSCVIYLHTHHGSKLQGTNLIEPLLSAHINVCLFDFAGYGNSQGDSVTLGIQQSEDIEIVIDFLKKTYGQEKIVLWGRSMGAVASIIYQSKNKNTAVIASVFDSPFNSLQRLTIQLGSKNMGIPQALIKPFVYLIKKNLSQKINFEELQLLNVVKNINTPALFIASKQDQFVSCQHSEELYQNFGGQKQLLYIAKDHNQPRKSQELSQIFSFVQKQFGVPRTKSSKRVEVIIQRHFKFIDEFEGTNIYGQYFKRETTANQVTQGCKSARDGGKRKDHLMKSKKPVLPISYSSKLLELRKRNTNLQV